MFLLTGGYLHVLQMRQNFEAAGGRIFENVNVEGVDILEDCAQLTLHSRPSSSSSGEGGVQPPVSYGSTLNCRLLLDCMGHGSPIVKQLRYEGGGGGDDWG
jgi:hypothetical protein